KSFFVTQVRTHRIVCPGVSNVHRVCDLVAPRDNGVVFYLRLGPHELLVFTRKSYAPYLAIVARNKSRPYMVERNPDFVAFGAGRSEQGSGIHNVVMISELLRSQGESLTDGFLIARVDVVPFTEFYCDRHRSVWLRQRFPLCIAQGGPVAFRWMIRCFHKIRQLNEEERKIPPVVPPVSDHGSLQSLIGSGTVGVAFSLVPDKSLECKGKERGQHGVKACGRLVLHIDALRKTFTGKRASHCVLPVPGQVDGVAIGSHVVGFVRN